MLTLLKGILIGIIIAIPVGPVAILCVQRTLTKGRRHGFVSGLGAAVADSAYGAIVVLGLTFTSQFIDQNGFLIRLLGGIALSLVGIRTYMSKPNPNRPLNIHIEHAGNFLSTFLLTAMNPITVFTFILICTNVGLDIHTKFEAILIIVGTFLGSSTWWLTICLIAGHLRNFIAHGHLNLINRIAGVVIFLIGLFIIGSKCLE